VLSSHPLPVCCAVCHRDLFWGHFCSFCTPSLQSVLNASAWMIFLLCRSNHITDTLACTSQSVSSLKSLCWRIKFFMRLHSVTWVRSSVYLIYWVGVVSTLPVLIAWSCHHSNYPLLAAEHLRVAAAQTWNALPEDVTASPMLPIFRKIFRKRLNLICFVNHINHIVP